MGENYVVGTPYLEATDRLNTAFPSGTQKVFQQYGTILHTVKTEPVQHVGDIKLAVYDPVTGSKLWQDHTSVDAKGKLKEPVAVPAGWLLFTPINAIESITLVTQQPQDQTVSVLKPTPKAMRNVILAAIEEFCDDWHNNVMAMPAWFWHPDNTKELARAIREAVFRSFDWEQ